MSRKLTTEEFISNAIEIHGDIYDYSKVKYDGNKVKVTIICREHGEFLQKPNNHISLKHGCPKCKAENQTVRATKSFNEFYNLAKEKFGNKFKYHEADFKGFSFKTNITCKIHGDFEQTPYRHITFKYGCPECAIEFNTKLPIKLRPFMRKVKGVVQQSFIRKGFTKKSRTYKLLGCSWEAFKDHLENNPYGFTIDQEGLDLDHIVPTSSASSEEDLVKLSHYTNFQLLPRVYNQNIKRNNKFNRIHFEEWLITTNYFKHEQRTI